MSKASLKVSTTRSSLDCDYQWIIAACSLMLELRRFVLTIQARAPLHPRLERRSSRGASRAAAAMEGRQQVMPWLECCC
jgi:hypothetical protein